MLSVVQERRSSFMRVVSLVSLLLLSVFGFLFFSSLHANAQDSLRISGADGKAEISCVVVNCDKHQHVG